MRGARDPISRPRRVSAAVRWAALAGLALLVAPSAAAWGTAGPSPAGPTGPGVPTPTFSPGATWNGQNIASASTPGTPFSYSFANPAKVVFYWSSSGGPPAGIGSVSEAKLIVLFFGVPTYTKDVVALTPLPASGGSINLTYDLTGDRYLIEGLFELQAILLNSTGATLWTSNFYIHATASYHFVVVNIALVALVLVEIYFVATVGPRAAERARQRQAMLDEERRRQEMTDISEMEPPK